MKVSSQSLSDQHQHNVTTCECCVTHHQQYLCERGLAGTSHAETYYTCWFTSTTGAQGLLTTGSSWISRWISSSVGHQQMTHQPPPLLTAVRTCTRGYKVLAVRCTLPMQSLINQLRMRSLDQLTCMIILYLSSSLLLSSKTYCKFQLKVVLVMKS